MRISTLFRVRCSEGPGYQGTSGQLDTASCRVASRASGVPLCFSKWAAFSQMDFFLGKCSSVCLYTARAAATAP